MKPVNTIVMSAVGGLLALSVASHPTIAQQEKGGEKCYGVAKAGKNDCQTANSACAGTAKQDGQKDAFVFLPKGTCEKLVGGSLEPAKS